MGSDGRHPSPARLPALFRQPAALAATRRRRRRSQQRGSMKLSSSLHMAILDEDNNIVPVDDHLAWAEWYEHHSEQRIVQQDRIGDAFISTVFLGLNHGWGADPQWFETMIFWP